MLAEKKFVKINQDAWDQNIRLEKLSLETFYSSKSLENYVKLQFFSFLFSFLIGDFRYLFFF